MKFKSLIPNATLFILAVTGTILTIELVYRSFFYQQDRENSLSSYNRANYYHPTPYTMFQGKPYAPTGFTGPESNQPIHFNRLGYRGDLPTAHKPSGEYRLFIVGGSTVFGTQVDLASAMQQYFFKKGYQHLKVFNFGAVSSNGAQEVARIVFEISSFKPDLILMYGGANDLEHPFYADPRPGYPFNFFLTESNPLLKRDLSEYPLLPAILFKSALMRQYFSSYFISRFTNKEQITNSIGYQSDSWLEEIALSYWEALEKAAKVSQAFGSDFIGVLQPLVYFKKELSIEEAQLVNQENLKTFNHLYQLILKQAQQSPSFTFYDKTSIFDQIPKSVFLDQCHIHDDYNDFLAEELALLVENQESFRRHFSIRE